MGVFSTSGIKFKNTEDAYIWGIGAGFAMGVVFTIGVFLVFIIIAR